MSGPHVRAKTVPETCPSPGQHALYPGLLDPGPAPLSRNVTLDSETRPWVHFQDRLLGNLEPGPWTPDPLLHPEPMDPP